MTVRCADDDRLMTGMHALCSVTERLYKPAMLALQRWEQPTAPASCMSAPCRAYLLPGAGDGCGKQDGTPSYALVLPHSQRYGEANEGQAARCRHQADERAGCVECHRDERRESTRQAGVQENDECPTTCE